MPQSAEYLPIGDHSFSNFGTKNGGWGSSDFFDKVNELVGQWNLTDFVWSSTNGGYLRMHLAVPIESDIGTVTSIRVYFAFLGALLGSTDMSCLCRIIANDAIKGNFEFDADTGSQVTYAYVDIPITNMDGSHIADIDILFRFFVNAGHAVDPPPQIGD